MKMRLAISFRYLLKIPSPRMDIADIAKRAIVPGKLLRKHFAILRKLYLRKSLKARLLLKRARPRSKKLKLLVPTCLLAPMGWDVQSVPLLISIPPAV